MNARAVHAHSVEAHAAVRETRAARQEQILKVVRESGPLTDRQIRNVLGLPDMNCVRPRINELLELGLLIERTATRDPETNRTVRTVDVPKRFVQHVLLH